MDADLPIEAGTTQTFALDVELPDGTPADLTEAGWDVRAQIRSRATTSEVTYTWSLAAGNVLLAPDGQPDRLLLRMEPGESRELGIDSGVWDLLLTLPDGRVARPVSGNVLITPSVTRPVTP